MNHPIWMPESAVLNIHDRQIAEHGGLNGIRDYGVIQSALAKPQNQWLYREPDIADLAAAYAFGLIKNHGFIDGNKRVGAVVAETFLNLNGYALTASDEDVVETVLLVAAGEMSERALAQWFRKLIQPEK